MTTGFNVGGFSGYSSELQSLGAQIVERGESIKAKMAALTTDGMQGQSAEAGIQFAQRVDQSTQLAQQVLAQLAAKGQAFGDGMHGADARGASAIGG